MKFIAKISAFVSIMPFAKQFYIFAGLELGILFLFSWYRFALIAPPLLAGDPFSCFDQGPTEHVWRISATAISVPLILDYLLDIFVSKLFAADVLPSVNSLEDRVGHAIIIASLLPISYIPVWLFPSAGCMFPEAFVNFSHGMLICGVLGKLETFSSDVLHESDALLVMTLFFLAQMVLMGSIEWTGTYLSYGAWAMEIASTMKLLSAVVFISSSRNWRLIFEEVKSTNRPHFFASRKYVCSLLFCSLVAYILCSAYFCYAGIVHLPQTGVFVSMRILVTVVFSVICAVLPGRVLRRGIQAAEKMGAIQREMAYKKTFIRYVSHEIRSPLATATIGLDCILEMLYSPDRLSRSALRELAFDCKLTCLTAIQTVSDLLLYDKIENNMMELECSELEPMKFFETMASAFERQIWMAKMRYDCFLDRNLERALFSVDRMKVEQVMRNFVSNAIKFTPMGGSIHVRAMVIPYAQSELFRSKVGSNDEKKKRAASEIRAGNSDRDDDTRDSNDDVKNSFVVKFEVEDSGAGISKENIPKLFNAYVQIDASKLQGGKGSGLGLWISKTIIEMHKGYIGVFSNGEGRGSKFYFELPLHLKDQSASFLDLDLDSIPAHETPFVQVGSTGTKETFAQYQSRQELNYESGISNSASSTRSESPSMDVQIGSQLSAATLDEQHANGSFAQTTHPELIPSFRSSSVLSPPVTPRILHQHAHADLPAPSVLVPTTGSSTTKSSSQAGPSPPLAIAVVPTPLIIHATKNDLVGAASANPSRLKSSMIESYHTSLQYQGIAPCFHSKQAILLEKLARGEKLKMLLADDTLLSRKMLDRMLRPFAAILVHATNGLDAVEKVVSNDKSFPFDVILMDYYMPGLDGPDAIHRIRFEANYQGMIMAVTAAASNNERDTLLEAGADLVINKPFNVDVFRVPIL